MSSALGERLGRLPTNLTENLSSAKAVELKNFSLYISEYVFQNLLPFDHMLCWRLLLRFLRLICSPVLTPQLLENAQVLLKNYLTRFCQCFPSARCSINFHMATHLKECCEEMGPISVFWCFAFERLNGELQKIVTNDIYPEIQILCRILLEMMLIDNFEKMPIPISIANFIRKDLLRKEDTLISTSMARVRTTICPRPTDIVTGGEPLDIEYLGKETFSSLQFEEFKFVEELTQKTFNNIIKVHSRIRLGKTEIHSKTWEAKSPCFIKAIVQIDGKVIKLIAEIDSFFSIDSLKSSSFHFAKITPFVEGKTGEIFQTVMKEKMRSMIIPTSRIENLVVLIPEKSHFLIIELPEI